MIEKQVLQTVARTLTLLKVFTFERPEWSLKALTESMGINKSIVFRMLQTLESQGFVRQMPDTKRYRLGPQAITLGAVAVEGFDIIQVANPHMLRLAHGVGETVLLTVLQGDRALCLHRVESDSPLRVSLRSGELSPLHAGASNKVILAYLPTDRIDAILASTGSPGEKREALNLEQLAQQIEKIHEQGWVFSDSELTPYVSALAVPIMSGDGHLIGGLSLAGPNARFTSERAIRVLPQLQETAQRIAHDLPNHLLYS